MIWIVSTPIGNLGDITIRALETLKDSDVIVCEDTRVTDVLLKYYNIKKRLIVYNDHSDHSTREKILHEALAGSKISLVTDAGTPMISDPGYKLINYLRDNRIPIDITPGVSAHVAALTLSGFRVDRFVFIGFLSKIIGEKTRSLECLATFDGTIIFFETAQRLCETVDIVKKVFKPYTKLCIARELTKKYQEIIVCDLGSYSHKELRGEIVVLIQNNCGDIDLQQIELQAKKLLQQNYSVKDVADILSVALEISRNKIYSIAKNISAQSENL